MKSKPCPKCKGTGRIRDEETFGQSMRQKREKSGLSLTAVAGKMHISAPYLSDLEHGKRHWSDERTKQFVKFVDNGR